MTDELRAFGETCQRELAENILPFWMEYGWDREHGGVYTCLNRDGTVAQPAKGNLFKGPFHIPRMLVKCAELCGKQILTSETER